MTVTGHYVADRGYFSGDEILACDQAGITPFVPKPLNSNSEAEVRFGKPDFIYIASDDEYRCPAGQRYRAVAQSRRVRAPAIGRQA